MVAAYINYFRNLAERHPSILHQAVNESLNGDPSLCRFGRFWNLDLYMESPPSGTLPDGPCVHLQMFDMDVNDQSGHYAVRGDYKGGLLITSLAIQNDAMSEEQCLTECYEIALDFLKNMWENSTSFCGDFALEYEKVQLSQVGPIWDNRYGWYLTFGMTQQLHLDTRPNAFL